jgi:hypothetical protein
MGVFVPADSEGEIRLALPGALGPGAVNIIASLQGPSPFGFQDRTHHLDAPLMEMSGVTEHVAAPDGQPAADAEYHVFMRVPEGPSTHSQYRVELGTAFQA